MTEQGLIVIYNQGHFRDIGLLLHAHIYIFNILTQLNIHGEDLSFGSFNFKECACENSKKIQCSEGIHYWIALAFHIIFLITIAVLFVLQFAAFKNIIYCIRD